MAYPVVRSWRELSSHVFLVIAYFIIAWTPLLAQAQPSSPQVGDPCTPQIRGSLGAEMVPLDVSRLWSPPRPRASPTQLAEKTVLDTLFESLSGQPVPSNGLFGLYVKPDTLITGGDGVGRIGLSTELQAWTEEVPERPLQDDELHCGPAGRIERTRYPRSSVLLPERPRPLKEAVQRQEILQRLEQELRYVEVVSVPLIRVRQEYDPPCTCPNGEVCFIVSTLILEATRTFAQPDVADAQVHLAPPEGSLRAQMADINKKAAPFINLVRSQQQGKPQACFSASQILLWAREADGGLSQWKQFWEHAGAARAREAERQAKEAKLLPDATTAGRAEGQAGAGTSGAGQPASGAKPAGSAKSAGKKR